MSTRIRSGLGGFKASTSGKRSGKSGGKSKTPIGRVFGVITTENTPTKELFEANGGWKGIGTVFYLPYETSKYLVNVDLNTCQKALPLYPNTNYPLVGELIHLVSAPSPASQDSNTSGQKYYSGTVNIWNNIQQNSPADTGGGGLGDTFIEKADIRSLISFEGDVIQQGRKGNGVRFGSTIKSFSDINEWSSIGNDGDPITIMVNGYVTTDTGSLKPNVEEINKELSSIYLTSTQKLPLFPGASIVNPRVNTITPNNYTYPQIILNSDRITLNAKKDEVLLFAKTNIELNSDNIININAGRITHINSPSIALGIKDDGSYPTEPVLLGEKTHELFEEIFAALTSLAGFLSTATVALPTGPMPIPNCNTAGQQLFNDIDNLISKLETITSTKVYTI